MRIFDSTLTKNVRSPDYNYFFDKRDGFFARWGRTKESDPSFAPSPELIDIEVTTICHGPKGDGKGCSFCYKSNNPGGTNMSLEVFQQVLNKLPRTVCQIAFGVDSQATSNPNLFRMMALCREQGIIPNLTVANVSETIAYKIAQICGSCAVSRYEDKDLCYDSIKRLTDAGLSQTNLHLMISSETYYQALETLADRLWEPRLQGTNAIVLLSLKRKGRGEKFTPLSQDKFELLVKFALENKIRIGFDSCSAFKFLEVIQNRQDFECLKMLVEPCESSAFSLYCNSDGQVFPCSFAEGENDWQEGLDILSAEDFGRDIWFHPRFAEFRDNLCQHGRQCPLFEI